MREHYVVTADHGHLRIFLEHEQPGQTTPVLDEIQALDFPGGVKSYMDRETDMAGRFQNSKQPAAGAGAPTAHGGMSIDERLPMQREEARRRINALAEVIEAFFATRPQATWDFAAPPKVHNAVLKALPTKIRRRLRLTVSKDLVHQRTEDLQAHFVGH